MNARTLRHLQAQFGATKSFTKHRQTRTPWVCPRCLSHSQDHRRTQSTSSNPYYGPNSTISDPPHARQATSVKNEQTNTSICHDKDEKPASSGLRELLRANRNRLLKHDERTNSNDYGIRSALLRRDRVKLLNGLDVASRTDPDYIAQLPKSTWSEILYMLSPMNFGPDLNLNGMHRTLTPARLKRIGFNSYRKHSVWSSNIRTCLAIRSSHSIPMDLVDYRILLRYAAMARDTTLAKTLMEDMRRGGVVPDVHCLNSYMETLVYERLSRPEPRNNLDDGSSDIVEVSQVVKEIFEGMLRDTLHNQRPNQRSFRVLLVALAEGGEINTIKEVVWNVWGIDLDKLASKPEENRQIQPADTAISPDAGTLHACVIALGSTGNIQLALRLVDYMYDTYNIKPMPGTWYQLIFWTWKQARKKATDVAQRPSLSVVPMLFSQLTSSSFRIDPSIDMVDIVFSTAMSTQPDVAAEFGYDRVIWLMELGRQAYIQSIKTFRKSTYHLDAAQRRKRLTPSSRLSRTSTALENRVEKLLVKMRSHRARLEHWFRLAIRQLPRNLDDREGWLLRQLPDFVRKYGYFGPNNVAYEGLSGRVELEVRSPLLVANRKRIGEETYPRYRFKWFHPLEMVGEGARVSRRKKSSARWKVATRGKPVISKFPHFGEVVSQRSLVEAQQSSVA